MENAQEYFERWREKLGIFPLVLSPDQLRAKIGPFATARGTFVFCIIYRGSSNIRQIYVLVSEWNEITHPFWRREKMLRSVCRDFQR